MVRFVILCSLFLGIAALSACSSGPYIVYFRERSAQLDPEARNLITLAARRANNVPAAPVEVIGYTDSAGSPPADFVLSRQRAQAVADALTASGVAPSRLKRIGRGQTGIEPGIASRRVEIDIGGI